MSAQNASRWQTQQQDRAKSFTPKKPELPGDYVGGGVLSGRSQTPQLPVGTEKFVGNQIPREWCTTMSVAVLLFVFCVTRKKWQCTSYSGNDQRRRWTIIFRCLCRITIDQIIRQIPKNGGGHIISVKQRQPVTCDVIQMMAPYRWNRGWYQFLSVGLWQKRRKKELLENFTVQRNTQAPFTTVLKKRTENHKRLWIVWDTRCSPSTDISTLIWFNIRRRSAYTFGGWSINSLDQAEFISVEFILGHYNGFL